jgi:hypothetical protein
MQKPCVFRHRARASSQAGGPTPELVDVRFNGETQERAAGARHDRRDRYRSGTSADRVPADAWKSSRASVCGSSSDPLRSSERRTCGSAFVARRRAAATLDARAIARFHCRERFSTILACPGASPAGSRARNARALSSSIGRCQVNKDRRAAQGQPRGGRGAAAGCVDVAALQDAVTGQAVSSRTR